MSKKNGKLKLRASRAHDGRAIIEALLDDAVVARDTCDLRSTDDRRRCAAVIHNAVPALTLESIEDELLAIDANKLPPVSGDDEPWGEPVSIERPRLQAFPVGVLPSPLRSWVVATAEATQTPSDLAGLLALAVCAGAVARRVEVVAGRGWREPINLYAAVLLEPGNRKSAVFAAAMHPLRLIEREMIHEAAPDIAARAAERRIKEKELATAEKKAAGGCGESRATATKLAEELAIEPIAALPKLLVDDATAEAVEITLMAQGGRLVVAGCEGGLFDVMAGRYSSGVGNFDCFLKGHAGDSLRVDRVIRGSIVIDRCCLTLAYAVQPDVLRGMAERPSFRGRGLIGRFLYAVPESRLGSRRINAEPVSHAIESAYEQLVRRLAAIDECDDGPQLLTLSRDASVKFYQWQVEVEGWLADDGRLVEMRDWAGKLCGLTARLAAVMHLIETECPEPWRVPISVAVIESAIELGRWAVHHALAVIGLMGGADSANDDAIYLLRWLRERALAEFTRRDAGQHGRNRFDGDPARLDDSLELLADRGWIRRSPTGDAKPGRPSSPRYAVHPRLCESKFKHAAKHPQNTQNANSEYCEDAPVHVEKSIKRERGVI